MATSSGLTSVTPGAGAGTGATADLTAGSDDISGEITVTTGTTPSVSAVVVTLNFGATAGAPPRSVIFTPSNEAAAALTNMWCPTAGFTSSKWDAKVGTAPLAGVTTYKWYYQTNF